jgi:hypothetical protein
MRTPLRWLTYSNGTTAPFGEVAAPCALTHAPAKHALGLDPEGRSGSPKDMRRLCNLRRFPFISDHPLIPYERETP